MSVKLEHALAELFRLPVALQDLLADDMLSQIEKLRSLRCDLDEGLASLSSGRGRLIDVEDVIREAQDGLSS